VASQSVLRDTGSATSQPKIGLPVVDQIRIEPYHRWFPPIYKFMNRKYVGAFLKQGRIKIGTSEEYRIPDGFDDGRSDVQEMNRKWNTGPIDVKLTPDHPLAKVIFPGKEGMPPDKDVTLSFKEGSVLAMVANSYIFSASQEYNDELAGKMAEVFNANACVKINDPVKFMEIITQCEPFKGRDFYLKNATYVSTNEFSDFGHADAFKKLEKFAWQREFRIIWGGEPPKAGVIIDVPEIVPLLSRM
jgi:hypothetical protein